MKEKVEKKLLAPYDNGIILRLPFITDGENSRQSSKINFFHWQRKEQALPQVHVYVKHAQPQKKFTLMQFLQKTILYFHSIQWAHIKEEVFSGDKKHK